MLRITALILLLMSTIVHICIAQQDRDYIREDSIYMSEPYPYILPILGDRAHERGYKPQLPFGIMLNTLSVNQTLAISNLRVGFGNYLSSRTPTMYSLDSVTAFEPIEVQTSTINARIDAWILPFWNIYGIVGSIRKANIDVMMTEPFPLSVQTPIQGWYLGYGSMLSGKVGPLFVSLDYNRNSNHNPNLTRPAVIHMASMRLGPIIEIPRRPNMKIIFWLGAMYSQFDGHTTGSIPTVALAPDATAHVDAMHDRLDQWYDDLGPIKQNLYAGLHDKLGDGLESLKDGVNNTYITYEMNKRSPRPWNMLAGVQYQYDEHWQARVEAEFLGARLAGLFSINYRFGIRGRTWGSGR